MDNADRNFQGVWSVVPSRQKQKQQNLEQQHQNQQQQTNHRRTSQQKSSKNQKQQQQQHQRKNINHNQTISNNSNHSNHHNHKLLKKQTGSDIGNHHSTTSTKKSNTTQTNSSSSIRYASNKNDTRNNSVKSEKTNHSSSNNNAIKIKATHGLKSPEFNMEDFPSLSSTVATTTTTAAGTNRKSGSMAQITSATNTRLLQPQSRQNNVQSSSSSNNNINGNKRKLQQNTIHHPNQQHQQKSTIHHPKKKSNNMISKNNHDPKPTPKFSIQQKQQHQLLMMEKKKKVVNFDIQKKPSSSLSTSNKQSSSAIFHLQEDAFLFHNSNILTAKNHMSMNTTTTLKNNNNNVGLKKGGVQKLRTRKKRLTPLKKQVLKERLLQWKLNQCKQNNDGSSGSHKQELIVTTKTPIVYLVGFLDNNEYIDDDDEYQEIISDLKDMAEKIGPIHSLYVPRLSSSDHHESYNSGLLSFVRFNSFDDANSAKHCWDGMTIGGNLIQVGFVSKQILIQSRSTNLDNTGDDDDENEIYEQCLEMYVDLLKDKPLSKLESSKEDESIKNNYHSSGVVILGNILTEDDLEDKECMEESLEDIKALASKYGELDGEKVEVDEINQIVTIVFKGGDKVASFAVSKLNGTKVGGQIISAQIANYQEKIKEEGIDSDYSSVVYLQGFIDEKESVDDDEEFEEISSDLKQFAEKVGPIHSQLIPRDVSHGLCFVNFQSKEDALKATSAWDNVIIGGNKIKVGIISKQALQNKSESRNNYLDHWQQIIVQLIENQDVSDIEAKSNKASEIVASRNVVELRNILTDDDFEDESCMEESLNDIRMLASQYGPLSEETFRVDHDSQVVYIKYEGDVTHAVAAAAQLDGLTIGGQAISAKISQYMQDNNVQPEHAKQESQDQVDETKVGPMYSGDKIIPEQYAECKRVPKVPNSGKPRVYASLLHNDNVIPLLNEMLGELMRLQLRSKDDKNANARRRLVLGLREVARGIRANKVKMVICANNLDEYGVIDEKIQAIIDLATERSIPIIYELNKRKIGKAIGKTIKVSIVGIQNADGAQIQFKALKKIHHQAT